MKQLSFEGVNGWGGKRRGSGRKNRSGLNGHARREGVSLKTPLHITMKLKPKIANLRSQKLFAEFRSAVAKAKRFGLHVIHYSLQGDHLHMIVEADNARALASGLKSFGSRFGKAIRRAIGGAGSVFAGRYHVHILKTPTEMKRALLYVLTNISKHAKLIPYIDNFSSGFAFKDWRELIGRAWNGLLEDLSEMGARAHEELSEPRSWLACIGWKKAYR